MLLAPDAARWLWVGLLLRFRLRFFRGHLLLQFAVTGLSAVLDFGQEFAKLFDLGLTPEMDRHASAGGRLRSGHLPGLDVPTERHSGDAQHLCRFTCGIGFHSVSMIPFGQEVSRAIFAYFSSFIPGCFWQRLFPARQQGNRTMTESVSSETFFLAHTGSQSSPK